MHEQGDLGARLCGGTAYVNSAAAGQGGKNSERRDLLVCSGRVSFSMLPHSEDLRRNERWANMKNGKQLVKEVKKER